MDVSTAIELFPTPEYLLRFGFRQLSGGEWIGDCPRCSKPEKVAVNVAHRRWHCFVCERREEVIGPTGAPRTRTMHGGGGLIDLIMWLEGLAYRDAVGRLVEWAQAYDRVDVQRISIEIDEEPGRPRGRHGTREAVPELPAIPAPEGWAPIDRPLPYLERRGITMDDVHRFGLFQVVSGRLANRVVFPVWHAGRLVYWQARAMWEASEHPEGGRYIKAINPRRETDPATGASLYAVSSDVLFNLDQARHYPSVVLCEGPIDAIHVGPDAICGFGKQLSDVQLARLVQAGVRRLEIAYDGPSETEPDGAWPEALALGRRLRGYFSEVRMVALPWGDPGDYDRGSLNELRAHALPIEAVRDQGIGP